MSKLLSQPYNNKECNVNGTKILRTSIELTVIQGVQMFMVEVTKQKKKKKT